MDQPQQIQTTLASSVLVEAINNPEAWERYSDALAAAKRLGSRTRPKVVVAILGKDIHLAIGFPSDQHSEIADRAFSGKLGADWKSRSDHYGGGDLKIDFENIMVEILGCSSSLNNRSVPKAAEGMVIQEVRKLINQPPQNV